MLVVLKAFTTKDLCIQNRRDMTASSCLFHKNLCQKRLCEKNHPPKKTAFPSHQKIYSRHFKDWRAGLAGRKGALGFLGGLLLVILYIFTKDSGLGVESFSLDVFFF